MDSKVVEKGINSFGKVYFAKDESERDINEWVGVIDDFIWYFCNKYSNVGDSDDDRYQMGWMAVVKALKRYQYKENVKLSSYLGRCIENEFKMAYSKTRKTFIDRHDRSKGIFATVSYESAVTTEDSEDNAVLAEAIGEIDKDIDNPHKYLLDELKYFLNTDCDSRERELVKLYIVEGKSQPEISSCTGISQTYISKIIRLTLRRFKAYYFN